jgi:hypothetical protein
VTGISGSNRRPSRPACGLLLVLLLSLTACTAPVSPAAAAPRSFFGLQAWTTPGQVDFQRMGRAHAGVFRFNLTWTAVEPTRGKRNWAEYDNTVGSAARAGMNTLPVFGGSPRFAARRTTYPPKSGSAKSAFAKFVRDAASRYGRGGAFWRAHPGIPYHPVRAWQVWNEPNFPAYWFGHPNARQYVGLLKSTRAAIKSRDGRARIVLAGLPETANGVPAATFLKRIYGVKGAKTTFDVAAVHPYARNTAGVLGAIKRARKVMRRAGDVRTQLWVTELGWATAGAISRRTRPFRTSRAGQARKLKSTYRALLRARGRYRLGLLVWFSLRDRPRLPGERNYWAINTGLFTSGGKAKPAWRTYARLAGGAP